MASSLDQNISGLVVRTSTEFKLIHTLLNGNVPDLSALTFGQKLNLVSALNELKGIIDGVATSAGAQINDAAVATTSVYSSSKVVGLINAGIAGVVDSSPTTLDTLKELAAALGNDKDFATNVMNALGLRLRVDATQGLTAAQKAQGLANLGAVAAADVGSTSTDYVALFNSGLS